MRPPGKLIIPNLHGSSCSSLIYVIYLSRISGHRSSSFPGPSCPSVVLQPHGFGCLPYTMVPGASTFDPSSELQGCTSNHPPYTSSCILHKGLKLNILNLQVSIFLSSSWLLVTTSTPPLSERHHHLSKSANMVARSPTLLLYTLVYAISSHPFPEDV